MSCLQSSSLAPFDITWISADVSWCSIEPDWKICKQDKNADLSYFVGTLYYPPLFLTHFLFIRIKKCIFSTVILESLIPISLYFGRIQVNLCLKLLLLHQLTHNMTTVHENYKLRTSEKHLVYTTCSPDFLSLYFSCTELVKFIYSEKATKFGEIFFCPM